MKAASQQWIGKIKRDGVESILKVDLIVEEDFVWVASFWKKGFY
jgi:hypothetical protein